MQQGSLYGKNFAVSGGVSAAVAQVLKEEGFDMPVTCNKCNGAAECKKALMMLKVGKLPETIIEGMACVGGCVNGPAKSIDVRSAEPFRHNLLDEADDRNITDNLTDYAFSVDMKDGRLPDELPDLEP